MSLTITIKVIPLSGKQEIILNKNGNLICYLKKPAEKNKANEELLIYLAHKLNCPRSTLLIIKGATNRNKTILIKAPITLEELYTHLGILYQNSIKGI